MRTPPILRERIDADPRFAVTCPHCKAEPGIYCRNRGGYTVPPHKAREQLTLSSTPARETVPAQDIAVGDFTTVTGYRQVIRVDLFPRRREVRLWWRRGHQTFPYDTPLKVSRP